MTQPGPEHTQEPFPSGNDAPPPGRNRKTTIVVGIVVAVVVLAVVVMHLSGAMGH